MKTVCVYCGASSRVDEKYKEEARKVGLALAKAGCRIVYGGGSVGLMGIIAQAGMEAGTEVVGIIPGHIDELEEKNENLTELYVVETMHERKAMMASRADAFLILPGGLGTMDEFFEIVTWRQLGLHDKSIMVYNFDGYWEGLKVLLDKLVTEKFLKDHEHYKFYENFSEILNEIKEIDPSKKEIKKDII